MRLRKDNIFIAGSVLFLIILTLIFGVRFFYFYNNEKRSNKSYTLSEYILREENKIKRLKKDNNRYYFYGDSKYNYLNYDGMLYRIIYIEDNKIAAITNEIITNLNFGNNSNYEESEIKKWLEENFDKDINNKYVLTKSKLLEKNDYIKIGSNNSFVKDEDFWILDKNKALILTDNMELVKTNNYSDFLGVKPVVIFDGNLKYINGDGKLENPYIVYNRIVNEVKDLSIGEYINYENKIYRVIKKDNDSVKVVSLNRIQNMEYGENEFNLEDGIGRYLNNTYLKELKNTNLQKKEYQNVNAYIGLSKLGDYFIKNNDNTYLLDMKNSLVYSIYNNIIYLDETNIKRDIYPVFNIRNNLKIISGIGDKDTPYVVGD